MIKFLSNFFHPIPSDYEEWLENLALKGWHPKEINKWNSLVMGFEKKALRNIGTFLTCKLIIILII